MPIKLLHYYKPHTAWLLVLADFRNGKTIFERFNILNISGTTKHLKNCKSVEKTMNKFSVHTFIFVMETK